MSNLPGIYDDSQIVSTGIQVPNNTAGVVWRLYTNNISTGL